MKIEQSDQPLLNSEQQNVMIRSGVFKSSEKFQTGANPTFPVADPNSPDEMRYVDSE